MAHFLNAMQNNQLAQSQLAERTDERVAKMAKMTHAAFTALSQQIQSVSNKQVKVVVTVHQEQEQDQDTGSKSSTALSYSASSSRPSSSAFHFDPAALGRPSPPPPATLALSSPAGPALRLMAPAPAPPSGMTTGLAASILLLGNGGGGGRAREVDAGGALTLLSRLWDLTFDLCSVHSSTRVAIRHMRTSSSKLQATRQQRLMQQQK
ncbi:unnamed protein product [Tilletia controversa]|nr:unnamed protein product [Tilletia controversa]